MALLKSLILFTADPWESAMPVIRVIGPAKAAHVNVIRGYEDHKICLERIPHADIVIIQRDFPHQTGYDQVVACARAANKPIAYEIDDLLFELPVDHFSYEYYLMALLPMAHAAMTADAVITSMPPLKDYLSDFNPYTYIIPNRLDDTLWSFNGNQVPGESEYPVVIGYMGGRTHLPDLEMISPVLLQILEKYGDRVRLRFWGGSPPAALLKYPQVEWIEINLLDYQEFAAFFGKQSCHFFIAPLRPDLFNRCKSPIKYLEYGILGIPGVFSRIDPYETVIQPGVNGLLAGSLEEWKAHLTTLIENPQLRYSIGKQALMKVQNEWLLSRGVEEWLETYQGIFDSAGKQPRNPENGIVNALTRGNMAQRKLEERIAFQSDLENQIKDSNIREQQLMAGLDERTRQLQAITNSRTWRFVMGLGKIRSFLWLNQKR